MPAKFKSRKKKNFKPKFKRRVVIPKSVASKPFPKIMTIKHRYVQNDTLSHATGGIDYQTYSCNSMFDPDFSGIGHQPEGYDIASTIWSHYTVIGSKITCRIVGAIGAGAGGNAVPIVFTLQTHPTGTPTYTDPTTASELSGAKTYVMGPSQDKPLVLSSNWSAKKTFGSGVMANNSLMGASGAGPTEQTFWTVSFRAMDQVTSVTCHMQVVIEYIAVWRELKTLTQS